jgi:hypothetical protein
MRGFGGSTPVRQRGGALLLCRPEARFLLSPDQSMTDSHSHARLRRHLNAEERWRLAAFSSSYFWQSKVGGSGELAAASAS